MWVVAITVAAVLAVSAPFACAQNTADDSSVSSPWNRVANMSMLIARRCLDDANTTECFRGKLLRALDMAIRDRADWHINDYVTFGRDPEFANASAARDARQQDYDENSVTGKLNELLRSRRVQFQTSLLPTASEGESCGVDDDAVEGRFATTD